MHSTGTRGTLPDVTSIIAFSKRLLSGISREEAKKFLKQELRAPVSRWLDDPIIVEHFLFPLSEINPDRVELYLDDVQFGCTTGRVVRERLKWKILLNAVHMTYFLNNRDKIPEFWKYDGANTRRIFFFGTTYEDAQGVECVPCLLWFEGAWMQAEYPISERWYADFYTATYDPEF